MWGTTDKMFCRSSRSKPFITDRTTIINPTPSTNPAIARVEIKETITPERFPEKK
jgi:hypothetical protein